MWTVYSLYKPSETMFLNLKVMISHIKHYPGRVNFITKMKWRCLRHQSVSVLNINDLFYAHVNSLSASYMPINLLTMNQGRGSFLIWHESSWWIFKGMLWLGLKIQPLQIGHWLIYDFGIKAQIPWYGIKNCSFFVTTSNMNGTVHKSFTEHWIHKLEVMSNL